ncbi:triose-phosphate isomerase [Thermodesulfobacteriota bacterium]
MRTALIAGNWKMNKTPNEAVAFTAQFIQNVEGCEDVGVVIAPPATALTSMAVALKGTNILLAAQNVHWEESGAYTGEISAGMLAEIGCRYVIVGHSERRQFFGETNETVNKRIKAVLNENMSTILCVGELLEERKSERTEAVIEEQVREGLDGINPDEMNNIVVAYEPVWAIGTGETATPDQAQHVHAFIRRLIKDLYDSSIAEEIRIQYGGSVKPSNAAELMAQPDVDGALVGGASLDPESFAGIVRFNKLI